MQTRYSLLLISGLLFMMLSTSCNRNFHAFTEKMQNQNGWDRDDLQRIQFYLSQDLVLYRQVKDVASEIDRGAITMIDGREYEEVRIKRKTPGVAVFLPENNKIGVSFEAGDDSKYLMFGPNPKRSGQYVLLATGWKNKKGEVSYGPDKYYTSASAAYTGLMVNVKKVQNTDIKSRKAKGRTIN